eukprot:CAMPEP_0119107826 /NCGR_PEP_ID=MMETSP1180-20130426/11759_1 /TAXON_ID=3052 ORGANISM="Chlamydomonas cf sp, Strain CCMP681" /NCGR_SAMPLE_ID=MMETSP1180 /ASSEMBLY_ACC=CAM_ASM_000741 /LENGTH=131 /DNA_ID=CAMNT_0007093371 /DNA_START=277 /DNA_END=672 /DNA_ORIENTATION=-
MYSHAKLKYQPCGFKCDCVVTAYNRDFTSKVGACLGRKFYHNTPTTRRHLDTARGSACQRQLVTQRTGNRVKRFRPTWADQVLSHATSLRRLASEFNSAVRKSLPPNSSRGVLNSRANSSAAAMEAGKMGK